MRYPLPMLLCLVLFAPACMAQSHPADEHADALAEAPADAPRSAMGRVMGIMIEALRQDAMRNNATDALPASPALASEAQAGPLQVIEVGAAFRLQPDTPCDVQPCDRDPVPKLRIASQK